MDTWTTLYAVAKTLLLPPASPLLVGAVGLVLMKKWPGGARAIIGAAWLVMYALCTPLVADWLQAEVGAREALDVRRLEGAQAIVIPGGGLRVDAAEYGGDTLGRLSLERTRYGARLARESGLPVLVTGGRPLHATRSEADVMREVLEREYGVPVRWVENGARDTRENAQRTAALLLPERVRRIVLVVHSFDSQRFVVEFRAAGFEVVAAPTGIPHPGLDGVLDVLPHASALQASYYALYEAAGLLARQMR